MAINRPNPRETDLKKLIMGCLLVASFISTSARAEIIPKYSFFVDGIAGLNWLKIDYLVGFTYNAVLNGAGGYIEDGWRVARRDEVMGLFTNYIGAQNGQYDNGHFPLSGQSKDYFQGANTLIEKLGIDVAFNDSRSSYNNTTSYPDLHSIATQAFFDEGNGVAGLGTAIATISPAPSFPADEESLLPFGTWAIMDNYLVNGLRDTYTGQNFSTFLVKTAPKSIPEPSAMLLFVIGLFIMGISSRRVRTDI